MATLMSMLPTITMEEWEAVAPLGELEVKSIEVIKLACERRPIPAKFRSGLGELSEREALDENSAMLGSSRPATPLAASVSTRSVAVHALDPKQPIQTPQQFYDWFALIDRSVAHSQEAHFRAHAATIKEHLDTCEQLLQQIDLVDKEVDAMMDGWKSVEEGGRNLKGACERLLDERDKLLEITDEVEARLEYFQELEHATRLLNHPGESLVLQTDFLYMVERVDVCIEYLEAHRHYKEAEIYLFRYQQCMTRAMTLIKMYFVGSLRALSIDISKRLSEKDVSSTAQALLLYKRFTSVSQQLLPLLSEFERRACRHPQELSALLAECHNAYFSVRKSLLVPRIVEDIKGLDPGRTEIVELTRAGCSYLKQLCTDEYMLYRKFFTSGEDQLYQYLENLCDYLYDDLRPRILHEPRLTALCEVCTVLQALMVLDKSDLASDSDSDLGDSDNGHNYDSKGRQLELTMDLDQATMPHEDSLGKKFHISRLLQMILQDAQTRLFFKAQAVVQSEVRYFTPKSEDLKWPDILINARNPRSGSSNEIKEKESVSKIFGSNSTANQETWYPTLAKTVWVLEQLRDFVKPAIFEDIAQEAISLCRQSLIAAADIVSQRNGNELDGRLFLVRHLMILRDVGKSLDLDLGSANHQEIRVGQSGVASETVGLAVTDTLASMLSRTTSLLPDAFFASLGMPRSGESFRETQHGIDHELRQACEAVISLCVDPLANPLVEWADKMKFHIGSKGKSPQPSAASDENTSRVLEVQPATLNALEAEFRRACETDLRAAVGKLKLYLEEERTVRVLVEHIVDRAMIAYGEFAELLRASQLPASAGLVLNTMAVPELRAFLDHICQEQ